MLSDKMRKRKSSKLTLKYSDYKIWKKAIKIFLTRK